MGKQVRFYMLPDDEQRFVNYVLQNQSVVLLRDSSAEPKPCKIEGPLGSAQQEVQLRTILLWNAAFPIQQNDFHKRGENRSVDKQPISVESHEAQYYLLISNAPVVEFRRCFFHPNGQLVKGRIWAEMRRLESDAFVHKGQNFELWYDSIARWLRSHFVRIKNIDGYFGPSALEWYQSGGKLHN